MAKDLTFKIKVSVESDTDPEPWNGEGIAGMVIKSTDERRYTLAVAYPVNKPDVDTARDGYKDFAGPEAVEDCAWNYMTKSRRVGGWHEDGTDGDGDVVESYIYRGPDWVIKAADGSEHTVTAGDWLLGVRWSENAWQDIKEGRAAGMSPQGRAERIEPTPEALAGLRS